MTTRDNINPVRAGGDWAAAWGQAFDSRTGLSQHLQQKTRSRFVLVQLCFALAFCLLFVRLAHLTITPYFSQNPKIGNHTQSIIANTPRPTITDRNGVILATQISMTVLGANAAAINNAQEVVAQLQIIVPDLNVGRAKRLLAGNSRYVVLKNRLTPQQRFAVLQLGNPSLQLRRAPHRVYPTGAMAAHITGFAGSDMRGLAGLERSLDQDDDALASKQITTSIDIRVQHVVRDSLLAAMEEFQSVAAGAIVMDIHNGEIIAMVSLPDFDANRPPPSNAPAHFNRMTLGVYELGSVFKIFTAAMALESGKVAIDETFDTSAPLQIGRYKINDVHGENRALTIDEIITYSSNIGAARLALRVPADEHMAFLQQLQLTERLSFELPETAHALMPLRWTDIERATSSYGHGVAVTPLHAVVAASAIVNGGVLYAPSLYKVTDPVGERVISAATSTHLRRMMRAVIVEGTGGKADVRGYPVLGKTGSADKPSNGEYSHSALVTSFLGAFPAHAPRYSILVMLDEPKATKNTFGFSLAGWNAAPVAANIIRRSAPLLGIVPKLSDPQLASLVPASLEVHHAP